MISIRQRIIIVTLAVVSFAISGCAWFSRHSPVTKHDGHDELFAVKVEKTPFYEYGPQQSRGPDRELTKDTVVTVLKHSVGYSKVKLADGKQGFLANEDLIPAPERLIAETSHDEGANLPPPPPVKLPTSDNSPEFEPTPIPQQLMPQ